MARRPVLFAFLVAVSVTAAARAQTPYDPGCTDDHSLPHVELPNGLPFDAPRARALFRFHRQQEAVRELDAGRTTVRGPWRWRVPPDVRKELTSELDAFRNCLARTKPPQLATLKVRVVGYRDETSESVPRPGARVYVEELPVGRTDRDGLLTVRVPSGPIEVRAEVPISEARFEEVNLAPGESGSVEIRLSDGKEVDEHTTLVLAEAVGDIVPVSTRSLKLRFMQDGRVAPVARIEQIDAENLRGDFRADLAEQFRVVNGQIVATNAARVFEALRPRFRETIVLNVHAMDSSGGAHDGRFAFRVGQWPLSVKLEAPPSNPRLTVSRIEVGISLIGAGVAVQRVSDAKGRFEVASFPEGTVAVECVTVSGGKYYYADATLAHRGRSSVTVILRNVEDLKKGVPPLRR